MTATERTERQTEPKEWLIRDGHTGYYWRPNRCGYGGLAAAGLYTEREAKAQEGPSYADRKDKAVHISEVADELANVQLLIAALARLRDEGAEPPVVTDLPKFLIAKPTLRELRDAAASIYGNPEDCDECSALSETGNDVPCSVHRSARFYTALRAADEVLGPCVCGHHSSEHEDVDSTHCHKCACKGFQLPPATPEAEPRLPKDMTNVGVCQKHHYSFAEYETSCPYCVAEAALPASEGETDAPPHRIAVIEECIKHLRRLPRPPRHARVPKERDLGFEDCIIALSRLTKTAAQPQEDESAGDVDRGPVAAKASDSTDSASRSAVGVGEVVTRLQARIHNLKNHGAEICKEFQPQSEVPVSCGRCGYTAEVHDIRDANDAIALLTHGAGPTPQLEMKYRTLLWLGHGHITGLYGDDGEMQCSECRIDYKRDPLEKIETTAETANMERVRKALDGHGAWGR